MKIAIVQTNPIFGKIETNVNDALSMMSSVSADLYILPELFNTGYNFIDQKELRQLAETVSGFTSQEMMKFTKNKNCYVVYGFAELAEQIYNSCSLVGPEGFIGIYRKIHLFYREKFIFTPGNLGFPVFDLPIGKIGMMICFDWIYPEAARTLALKGAQLLAHPSNLILPHCPDAMVTRCLENRVFVATVNRVGIENRDGINLTFIGKSEVVSPRGEILVRLGNTDPEIAVVEVDLSSANNKHVTE
ncbi:MAG: nitrilase-related carbon-nitrogen hydrolase, partial [Bacteroidota bacterium]|nr:nitrilase-related carbon-nitrogen hydrolase [Bacteroidota bacterium]